MIDRLPLSAWYNRENRRWYYYVIDYVSSIDIRGIKLGDIIVHEIEYEGREIYEGDSIEVPGHGKMEVKLYLDKNDMYSTIISDARYDPIVNPRIGEIGNIRREWRVIGYVYKEGEFYKLYEKEYSSGDYRYRVRLYPGVYLNVKDEEEDYRFRLRISDEEKVIIDTMESKGEFNVKVYRYDDIML